MSIDHNISSWFAFASTMLVCFKVEVSAGFDVLLELGNEMVEPSGFGRRSRCFAVFACGSKASTP